ncbi:MAG: type II toxin-antitoxin system VapC family toxin [Planctomycetes bacterium]|nr:type II toxin-antitoxin system VapC family toxin [Planctomycetota bacterium]
MEWLLDTNMLIFAARDRPKAVRRRLQDISPDDVAVSSITIAELWYGAEKSDDPPRKREAWRKFLEPYLVLPFERAAAEEHARLRYLLRQSPIGERDLLVAAIASANGLRVVTNNLAEFTRVPGLTVEDWSK